MIIYVITNTLNGKKYVGKTTKNLEHRWKEHLTTARSRRSYPLYRAMRKYGTIHFTCEVLATGLDEEEINALEVEWIAKLKTFERGLGYNLTKGGDGMSGFSHSGATREKISIRARNRNPVSDETKKRMGDARRGKTHTEEARLKISARWDESRRDQQGAIAIRVNAIENAKLKDYACSKCGATFTQVTKGVFGGHRKACLMKKPIAA